MDKQKEKHEVIQNNPRDSKKEGEKKHKNG